MVPVHDENRASRNRTLVEIRTFENLRRDNVGALPRRGASSTAAERPVSNLRSTRVTNPPSQEPAHSSKPYITLKFCTAEPAAPFTRLSITDTINARPLASSTFQPMSQKFDQATCLIRADRCRSVARTAPSRRPA